MTKFRFQNSSKVDQAFRVPSQQFKKINGQVFLIADCKSTVVKPGETIEVEDTDAAVLRRFGVFVEIE